MICFFFSWLHVKHWLTIQRHHRVELASKRQWKRFWICLKGANLYLYHDYSDINPKLTLSKFGRFKKQEFKYYITHISQIEII